jgi:chlorobactene glucosyltransferase
MLIWAVIAYWCWLDLLDQARAKREPRLVPEAYAGSASVSVIIPARNEVENLPRCLEALLAQTYTPQEIWVIDDNSNDGTGELVDFYKEQDPRIQLIHGLPLAPGWTGKSFALSQGVARATGTFLLFVDADTCLSPAGLAAALTFCERNNLDLLSLTARQECETFWEQAIQPIIFGLLNRQYPLGGDGIAANGQFILVRNASYQAIGTHEAVRSEIVEDVALAQLFHRQGYQVQFINGTALFRTRMYRNLGTLWEGWSKNSYRLFAPKMLDTTCQLLARLLPWFLLAAPWGWLALAVALFCDGRIRARQAFRPLTAWLQAPGALLTVGIIGNSWLKQTLRLSTTWKGRSYPENPL